VKRTFIVSVITLALVLGFSVDGFAGGSAPVASRIVESGKLRVGMSGNQPPYNMMSESGTLIGFEVDIANMIAGAMGVDLELVQKPFAELLPALKKGEVDLVMSGMTMTARRNLEVPFVGPYQVVGKSILTKSSTLAAIAQAHELDQSKVKLVALKNSTSQEFVKAVWPDAKFSAVEDYDQGVQAVLDGKADALVADSPICAISLLRFPDKGLATLAKPLTIEPIGAALPPGDTVLLNMVENYLDALEMIGVLEALDTQWFEDAQWLEHVQ